jgi:STE24 endopeptidase
LLTLADNLGYRTSNLQLIDGSTRSEHSNAFCTGFGRFRRICLFDTLLHQLSPDEIVAVLGHEIGHDKLYHVHIGAVMASAFLLVELRLLQQFIASPTLAAVFFLDSPSVYTGFVLFYAVWGLVEAILSVPVTWMSRQHEHAADRFAVAASSDHASWLKTGLVKLMKHSKTNLTPHPFHVFLNFSHPPLHTRLQTIDAYQKEIWG